VEKENEDKAKLGLEGGGGRRRRRLRSRRGPHLPRGDMGKPPSLPSLSGCMEAAAKEREQPG